MDYNSLLNSKIEEIPKPGLNAQLKMAPPQRFEKGQILPKIPRDVRYAAVMMLLYPTHGHELSFCLIQRTTYDGKHSGQVSFPGGKKEEDDADFWATALRETQEEIGVDAKQVSFLTQLSSTYIPPSNFFVYPYMAIMDHRPRFIVEVEEVNQIIEVPLRELLCDTAMQTAIISASYSKEIEVPAFLFNHYKVWGATAMILSEARELIRLVK